MDLDTVTIVEIGVTAIGFIANVGVMRYMLGRHETTIEKLVDKLNVQDTEQKLQKQKVDEHEAALLIMREAKHSYANRLQAAEFKITSLETTVSELNRRRRQR